MGADRVIADGSLDPAVLVPLVILAAAYAAAARRARRRWPRRRTAAFLGGLAILAVASQSGIETWSERLLSVHMVEHLLIIGPAALLLVAGAPITLALRTLPRRGRAGLVRLLHSRAVRVVAHPLAALSIFAAVLVVTHVPAVYDAALGDPFVHGLEHALYLWAALLFWAPVVAADPLPHRLSPVGNLGYLLAAMIPMSAVGAWLISSDAVAYSPYVGAARRLGVSALADQRVGATIMWLGGTLVLVGATLAAAWTALVREERRARAREERVPAAVAGGPR